MWFWLVERRRARYAGHLYETTVIMVAIAEKAGKVERLYLWATKGAEEPKLTWRKEAYCPAVILVVPNWPRTKRLPSLASGYVSATT